MFVKSSTLGKIALHTALSVGSITIAVAALLVHTISTRTINSLPALSVVSENLTTDTWGIFDPETGDVLLGNNLENVEPIASVTKLFTAEAVMRSTKKDEAFTVAYADLLTYGESGKLTYGQHVTPYELLFPLLIESSNDAAVAIKRQLGAEYESLISSLITESALTKTRIQDPSGLSPENISTVKDLATFYAQLRRTYPHVLDITQLNTYVGPNTGYVNNNPARSLTEFRGGKHGYIPEANKTFVGTFSLPNSGGEIGLILLQSSDLPGDIEALLARSAGFETTSDIMAK